MVQRVILITGGTHGIGLAAARRFVESGDTVVITGRDSAAGKAAEQRLSVDGNVHWVQADVGEVEDCARTVRTVVEMYGRLNVLINNAGTIGLRDKILETNFENASRVMLTNVLGTMQMCVFAARIMSTQHSGVIVNVGSTVAKLANHESIAYHASKGAISSLTSAAALQLAPFNVRVIAVSPGWVATDIVERTLRENPGVEAGARSLHMSNRIIEPSQIAAAIYLLCSEDARIITGSTVYMDDGYASFKIPTAQGGE